MYPLKVNGLCYLDNLLFAPPCQRIVRLSLKACYRWPYRRIDKVNPSVWPRYLICDQNIWLTFGESIHLKLANSLSCLLPFVETRLVCACVCL